MASPQRGGIIGGVVYYFLNMGFKTLYENRKAAK